MLQSILRGALAIVLMGAASISQADESTVTALPHVEPIQLTYRAFDPQRTLINEQSLLGVLNQAMGSLTKWPLKTTPDTQSTVHETGARVKLEPSKQVFTLEYLAHSRFLSGGYEGSTLTIPIAYSVARGEDTIKISLTFPDQGRLDRHGLPFLSRKLWNMQEILDDYTTIAAEIQAKELVFNYSARGEVESNLKPDAVLGNLERLLTRTSRVSAPLTRAGVSGSVSRDETFVCTIGSNRREVYVSTFPYHDGTKVTYTAALPFRLKPDGGSAGDDEVTALKALMSKVVND